MPYVASDFVAVLDALGLDKVTLLGYSMGGRMALHISIVAPQRISKLVLESTTAGIRDEYNRENRREHDEQLAQMLEKLGLEKFVDFWEKQDLFDSQANLPASRREFSTSYACKIIRWGWRTVCAGRERAHKNRFGTDWRHWI